MVPSAPAPENGESHVERPALLFLPILSNQARMLSTLAMRFDGPGNIPPCEASGILTITVSTLRSFSAW
jgi:hypothetical protein